MPKINHAQVLAQLKKIPQQLLPSTLKYKLNMQKVKSIELHYHPQCKNIGLSFQFLRKYAADIRYHNPGIIIKRNCDPNGPAYLKFLVSSDLQQKSFDTIGHQNVDDFKDKLMEFISTQL